MAAARGVFNPGRIRDGLGSTMSGDGFCIGSHSPYLAPGNFAKRRAR
jgi:hypothetical protein